MKKSFMRHTTAWLVAMALCAIGAPAHAQQGTPEDRAQLQAQLDAALVAVRDARAAFEASQTQLATARANLDLADQARIDAEKQLVRTEAAAGRGRITRRQVDADRAATDAATVAVSAVRAEIAAAEANLANSQAKLMAAQTAVDATAASAARFLGEAPAN